MPKSTRTSHLLTACLLIAGMLTVISGAIALPILCRPVYYAQIEPLELTKVVIPLEEGARTLTRGEITAAYDEVLDFCTGVTDQFSAGILAFSESGAAHFADCRGLFLLDFWVLGISGGLVLLWLLLLRRIVPLRCAAWGSHLVCFWSAVSVLALFAVIGIGAAVDFDAFFVLFHHIFFPGKTNWLFDPRVDQVINIMPEQLFMNFGILIIALILLACAGMILADARWRRRNRTAPSEKGA